MSRMNEKKSGVRSTGINHEGARNFNRSGEGELAAIMLTSTLSKNFYESADETTRRLIMTAENVPLEFLEKAVSYTRNVGNMRTTSHLLAVILAERKGDWRYISDAIRRPDDMTEMAAFFGSRNKPRANAEKTKTLYGIPKPLRRAIKHAFESGRFNEYSFAKYRGDGKKVQVRDLMFLTHPKPQTEEQAELFGKIANKTLRNTDTWEATLSASGGEDKKEAWKGLINGRKLGYMAMLRNLRNIFEEVTQSSDEGQIVMETLKDPERVAKSKQFPFRFYSAYKALDGLTGVRKVQESIGEALHYSAANFDLWPGERVAVLVDLSASMFGGSFSEKSSITFAEIGAVFAYSMLQCNDESEVYGFGDTCKHIGNIPNKSIAGIQKIVGFKGCGHSTHLKPFFTKFGDQHFDRIVAITDGQVWDDPYRAFQRYRAKASNSNSEFYVVNVNSHEGSMVDKGNRCYEVSGLTDHTIKLLGNIGNGDAIVEEIYNHELRSDI